MTRSFSLEEAIVPALPYARGSVSGCNRVTVFSSRAREQAVFRLFQHPVRGAIAIVLFGALGALGLTAQTAEEIMARVAENQDRAQSARSSFVYHQNVLVRLKRANGKLAREEIRDFTVTPSETGITKELTHFSGKYEKNGKLFEYAKPEFHYKGLDIDEEIATELANDTAKGDGSRDGFDHDLFPLTANEQRKYEFHLKGKERYRDSEVFSISFEPKSRVGEEMSWAGEVLIDVNEFQPVLVTSHWAKGLPRAVKILLGTDIRQVGFKVAYQKFDEGLWFPVTYGGELKVRGLFLYARSISIGLLNSDFRKTDVKSTVSFDRVEDKPADR